VTLGPGGASARILDAAAALPAGVPPLAVHLEVETGLGRGGVLPEAVAAMAAAIRRTRGVRLAGVWTHLTAADDSHLTLLQDERFGGAVAPLTSTTEPDIAVGRHLAGSGGLLGGDARRWDAVRAGLSIYGLIPDGLVVADATKAPAARLRPVMSLCARPVRVVELPAGHGVSYGPTFVTPRPSRIATLPLGYADGWRRALSDRADALVRGVRVPLVGRVAMDAVMADVTDVPGAPITEEDEFVLIGEQGGQRITANDVASAGGTISYEVVAGMSRRLARVYDAAGSTAALRTLVDSGA
jgi:alanine racemase